MTVCMKDMGKRWDGDARKRDVITAVGARYIVILNKGRLSSDSISRKLRETLSGSWTDARPELQRQEAA